MSYEDFMINGDMLEAFEMQVFVNRLEKRKDELLPKAADEVLEQVDNGVPFEVALFNAATKLVDEIWEGDNNET